MAEGVPGFTALWTGCVGELHVHCTTTDSSVSFELLVIGVCVIASKLH